MTKHLPDYLLTTEIFHGIPTLPGKAELFNKLYNSYSPGIFGIISKHKIDNCEEILIKVFLHAWENLDWFIQNNSNHLLQLVKYTFEIIKKEFGNTYLPVLPKINAHLNQNFAS